MRSRWRAPIPGRSGVIAFSGAFHGRTLLGMALTGKLAPYKKGFGAMPPEIAHAPFPNALHGITEAEALGQLDRIFASSVDPERIAAMIIEPVQGEGGFNIAPASFLRALRQICDRYGTVLIADEVQAGMARTGRMFGFDHTDVVPDLVIMAKGLAGGFPLSAVTGRAEIVDAPGPGGLGGTYAGNPMAVAAALAVLDVIEDEALCARATEIGEIIRALLTAIAARQGMECIGEVRGLGAMNALELATDRGSNAPDAPLTTAVVAEAEARADPADLRHPLQRHPPAATADHPARSTGRGAGYHRSGDRDRSDEDGGLKQPKCSGLPARIAG